MSSPPTEPPPLPPVLDADPSAARADPASLLAYPDLETHAQDKDRLEQQIETKGNRVIYASTACGAALPMMFVALVDGHVSDSAAMVVVFLMPFGAVLGLLAGLFGLVVGGALLNIDVLARVNRQVPTNLPRVRPPPGRQLRL